MPLPGIILAALLAIGAVDPNLTQQADERGNRIPDFSHCGYRGGGVAIPDAPARVVVPRLEGDARADIQAAIDYVSRLPANETGLRGAVLLNAGRYEIAGALRITASGVVLRGQGQEANGTLLVATGTDRRTLIRILGRNDRQPSLEIHPVADRYVPVGARRLRLRSTRGLHVGDNILVERPSTKEWIAALGMDRAPGGNKGGWLNWVPGKMDVRWERIVIGVEDDTITLDSPLTDALDATLGTSQVRSYTWPGRISHVGVENLRCQSAFDDANPHDEEHAWMAITMEAVQNAWVRQVTAVHFASALVSIFETCKWVTVEDCRSLQPISELGGYRRHAFYTSGQMTLFQRCKSEGGRHDFAAGYLAAGPNAFVECQAVSSLAFSGPIESWASGVLYDNVTMDGGGLHLGNREIDGQGVGWAAANCVLWQCTAPVIVCRRPPTGQNWAFGCWGQFVGDGAWQSCNEFVKPVSLYHAQLADRLGQAAVDQLKRRPISTNAAEAKQLDQIRHLRFRASSAAQPVKPLSISNGWLVSEGELVTGGRTSTVWWRGSIVPSRAGELGVGVTRFVPGRIGPGYTDDLEQLTDAMRAKGQAILEHHWGLWYDRRRDDHQMVRRIDGGVWPPFYEQPWARSGKDMAWDGLSRYDLTRFNPWYFGRIKEFADLCTRKSLILLQQHYFQHNLLEAGAHWADFPWRPANCLQDTGFPEPPPYANNKRIFMAEAFYDVSYPLRRELHRAYIRKCLDNVAGNTNVIHLTGEEYTGPLSFVQFWLDVVAEWRKETGKRVLIGLSCTKDVQDAILADPVRNPQVDVLDLRYWWYAANGSLYAPRGGESLAPRQHWRQWEGSKSLSDAQTARQVREYRLRYPDKAVVCSVDRANGWAVLAAGGSVPNIPRPKNAILSSALPRMRPAEFGAGAWGLVEPGRNYLIFASAGEKITLRGQGSGVRGQEIRGSVSVRQVDARTGEVGPVQVEVPAEEAVNLPAGRQRVLWLSCTDSAKP